MGMIVTPASAKAQPTAAPPPSPARRQAPPSAFHRPAPGPRWSIGALPVQPKLTIGAVDDPQEAEADRVADRVMRMPDPDISLTSAPQQISRKCAACEEEDKQKLQMKPASAPGLQTGEAPPIVHEVLRSPGQPLDASSRAFFEPRFGRDFSDVRVHIDAKAAESAREVNALAYTVGRDIVLGLGQYSPGTTVGRRLLAHEMAHVRQQHDTEAQLQRTPAKQVSCANALPLHVPGQADVADPVGIITTAEDRANQMIDDVIDSLDFTRQQIIGGAPAAWPTISDALGQGLRLMGLDPDDAAIWTAPAGTGERSVPLLIRRLRLIRGTIGAGSFFFVCLGTGMNHLGPCAAPDICANAVAATCAGAFFTAFCPDFWADVPEDQAARIVHESAHNFATFIGHSGRFDNAECFARLVQVFAGVPEAVQRVDLCPNP
jgi:hypothetical protein